MQTHAFTLCMKTHGNTPSTFVFPLIQTVLLTDGSDTHTHLHLKLGRRCTFLLILYVLTHTSCFIWPKCMAQFTGHNLLTPNVNTDPQSLLSFDNPNKIYLNKTVASYLWQKFSPSLTLRGPTNSGLKSGLRSGHTRKWYGEINLDIFAKYLVLEA